MNPSLKIEIGSLFRKYREKKGLTQGEVGNYLNTSYQFVWQLEKGKCALPLNTIGKLVKFLDIPESQIKRILLDAYEREILDQFKKAS
jgi:transcriptional regulator with XRE-family HTH domain